jgi:hypothetical protein
LLEIDARIAAQVQRGACRFCGGRLHRGDYPRKPRGGWVGRAGETFGRRFSLCCSEEGCRRRATPPSVRFLGRRVYVSAVVVVASAAALLTATASQAVRSTGIAARTARRWLRWWRGAFPSTPVFVELPGRFLPALSRPRLPASILERLPGGLEARVQSLLHWLLPLTTAT